MRENKDGIYNKIVKRLLDILFSFLLFVILSPVLLILIIIGFFAMGGNPFFTQQRPGRNEKIFKLIKFRTMNNAKDKKGNLLDDEERLTGYGRFLRKTSLDELPEMINIFKGDMSFVGPRPLLVKYLPLYNEEQKNRHTVRPGLTGYAQANGRNALSWEKRFEYDVYYVENISFTFDFKILIQTVSAVVKRDGISSGSSETMEEFKGTLKGDENK